MYGKRELWRQTHVGDCTVSNRGRVRGPDGALLHLCVWRHASGAFGSVMVGLPGIGQWVVARLVLFAFMGPPPKGKPCALHFDDDPNNNDLSNLRWGSRADNVADQIRNGNNARGEANGHAKLTCKQVKLIRVRYKPRCAKNGLRPMAREFGVAVATMQDVLSHRTWRMG